MVQDCPRGAVRLLSAQDQVPSPLSATNSQPPQTRRRNAPSPSASATPHRARTADSQKPTLFSQSRRFSWILSRTLVLSQEGSASARDNEEADLLPQLQRQFPCILARCCNSDSNSRFP